MSHEEYRGVQISVPSSLVEEALVAHASTEWAKGHKNNRLFRGGDTVSLFYNALPEEVREFLYQKLRLMEERGMAGAITALRNAEKDPSNCSVGNLKVLAKVLAEYVKKDAIDGWLYSRAHDGVLEPWLVTSIVYEEDERDAPAHVTVRMVANVASYRKDRASGRASPTVVTFVGGDIPKKKVAEILAAKGYFKETQVLKDEHTASVERFKEILPMTNVQFEALGSGEEVDEERDWRNSTVQFVTKVKVINDEGLIKRKFFLKNASRFWEEEGCPFTDVPIHPRIFIFNLETHTNMWVHVDNLTQYVYDPSLKDKLILPQDHRDLVDILTQDMDVLMDDIVAGKSGGTTVLCKGGPGLGKTLTAEVYSEVIERPLYKVHSGQLGVHSEQVQKNLEIALKRAERWGAVMLIDEADVYIRKRGNDIDHNAVVASFLRTLEYFHGLLFMTTNRSDDVDDAIVSRCIATISYGTPSYEDAIRIWRVLADQFEMKISDSLVAGLAEHFDKISGRDIKELLKLVSKWCRRKDVAVTLAVFKQCAQFRGL